MPTPTDPALARRARTQGRLRSLRSRLADAKRQAAVVTSVALLAAGGTALTVNAPAPDLPVVAGVEAPAVVASPPPTALLPPPVALVSDGPETEAGTALGSGSASYYGSELAGNPTASGERFDPSDFTAAHRTLPFGTRVRVTHPGTSKSVVVRINDRGPFHGDRVIDVSKAAADEIGLTRSGTAEVELERLPERRGARG